VVISQSQLIHLKLNNMLQSELHFEGSDYVEERDQERLTKQHVRVYDLMKDGVFRTLPQISDLLKAPPASISAQLRHLRKPAFGSHTVNKKYEGNGLFSYQLIINNENHG
jgi:hypothetical protein